MAMSEAKMIELHGEKKAMAIKEIVKYVTMPPFFLNAAAKMRHWNATSVLGEKLTHRWTFKAESGAAIINEAGELEIK